MKTFKEIIQAAAAAFSAPPESVVAVDKYGNEWTYVQERTCHDQFGGKAWCFRCDNCGCVIPWKDSFNNKPIRAGALHYCPNCGRKVVPDEH